MEDKVRQSRQLSFFQYLIASLLLATLTLCAGCAGGSGLTAPVIDAAGDSPPPKAVRQGWGENPVAVPDASPRQGGVPLLVHFFGKDSYDPDGEIVLWAWNFGDATGGEWAWQSYTASEGEAWHEYTSPGIKVAQLVVWDNDHNFDQAFVKIDMRKGNNANPIAMASADPTEGYAPLTVEFSAAGSYDPDGTIEKYEWDLDNDGIFEDFTDTEGAASHEYTAEGTYTAVLQVTDDYGAVSMDSVEITVDAPEGPGDWWMFGREPTHNRRSPFTGPTTNALKWSYTTGSNLLSSPAIGAKGTIYIGSNDRKLYAISSDGNQKWTFTTGSSIGFSSPAIGADGTIYIGSDKLYAVNPGGTQKWSYATGNCAYSSPAIGADGTIYVCSGNWLYAIGPGGSLVWRYQTSGNAGYCSPAIGAYGTVYVSSGDGNIHAIKPDGNPLGGNWPFATGNSVYGSPSIGADGTVYVGCRDQKLYAIKSDGTLKWSYAAGSWILYSSPAIGADGTIYIGSFDHKLHAINADGTSKWSYTTGYNVQGSPTIGADGTVYVGSNDGKLYAINPDDGTLKWSYTTGSWVNSSPAIGADGTIFVGSQDYKLYAIGPGEGV